MQDPKMLKQIDIRQPRIIHRSPRQIECRDLFELLQVLETGPRDLGLGRELQNSKLRQPSQVDEPRIRDLRRKRKKLQPGQLLDSFEPRIGDAAAAQIEYRQQRRIL